MATRVAVLILSRVVGHRVGTYVGASLLTIIAAASIVGPALSSYGVSEIVSTPLASPSGEHLLGTDQLGRDVLTRTLAAGRIDLLVALIAVSGSMVVGTVAGTVAASTRSAWPERLLHWIVDVLVSFPFIVLVLTAVLIFGSTRSWGPFPAGLPALLVAVIIWDWTVYARMAALQTRALEKVEYVEAAHVLGYGRARILGRHVIPLVVRASIAYAVADAVVILMATAGLPFVGAGVQPPTPEWGMMMFEGRTVLVNAPWVVLAPGAVLACAAVALSLLADGLLQAEEDTR